METLFAALEASAAAEYLRSARWGYAAVNGAHVLGIALLVGAVLPLDLRLLGVWADVPRAALVRVLVPVAAGGLALATCAGFLMFSIRAREYAGIGFFQAKMGLVLLGAASAVAIHARHGFLMESAGAARLKVQAMLSLACWLGALACGRLIAFAGD